MRSMYQDLGHRIVEVLTERGWTQQYLADKLGISKQVMGKIIHGEKNTTIVELQDLAQALDVSIVRLLEPVTDAKKPKIPEEEQDLVVLFMGKITTEAGKQGLQRAFELIDLYLKHERLNQEHQLFNEQAVFPTDRKHHFRPVPVDSE